MNTPMDILLIVGAIIISGIALGLLTKFLSAKLFYPLLSQSEKLLRRTTEKDDESAYLRYVVDTCRGAIATRESAHVSPRIKLQDIFVMPFLSDEKGNSIKFSVKYILDSKARAFLIVGNAGSGKTSLLRHIQLKVSSDSLSAEGREDRILPFYVSLREFQGQLAPSLPALLEEQTPSLAKEKLRVEYYEKSLHKGRILILLDGLDEIRSEKNANDMMRSIAGWSQRYTTCKFIVTSRPARLESLNTPDVFRRLSLLPFSDGQITEFLRKWTDCVFEDLSDIFEDPSSYQQNRSVLRRLALENTIMSRPELKDLAASPLLLTLMCTTHYFTGSIPVSRTFIYQESVGLLLNKVDINVPKHQLQFVIDQIAFEYQKDRITVANKDYVCRAIDKSKITFSIDFETESVFSELIGRSGLLYERSLNQISFIHYSFQEFFAARYIVDSGLESSSLKELLSDQWWRDVILLSAEAMQEIDELCTNIINDDDIPDTDKVQLVGQILAGSKKVDREAKIKIVREIVSEILEGETDEHKQQMLLLASPHISSEIITIIGDVGHE